MNTLRHIIRGCKTLPHSGEHPGTIFLLGFVCIGTLAGMHGGWIGMGIGGLVMLVVFGPFYLWGAYERSRFEEIQEILRS